MLLFKIPFVFNPKRAYFLAKISLFCIFSGFAFVPLQVQEVQAQTATPTGAEITNAGIGFVFKLPAGWDELNPILMQLYNSYAGSIESVAGNNGEPVLMVAAYTKAAPGSSGYSLPPILFMHYVNQPFTAAMVEPYNQMFIEEAKDDAGKTRQAKKLGLASSVNYVGSKQLHPNTPLVTIKANTSFGFPAKIISAPFYSSEGILTVSFFAPESEFSSLEAEVMTLFRSLKILDANIPR